MRIKKAVITAAGRTQRALPLQTLIDRDGQEKAVICILIEQALAANVDDIGIVVHPGDEGHYAEAAGRHASSVRFISQAEPKGYGNAILSAREFTQFRFDRRNRGGRNACIACSNAQAKPISFGALQAGKEAASRSRRRLSR